MFSQGMDKVDDSEKLSAFTGAYADPGARKEGACVFFRVLAPFADEVFLVGSFDDWRDGIRLERGDFGVWSVRVGVDRISDGDRYKFKANVGGDTVYLSDPYAKENDGEPYYNSIFRSTDKYGACEAESLDTALNIYVIEPDKWLCYDRRDPVDYATLSRELLPYLLQMGYTHVCLSGCYDRSQGGKEALSEFIKAMHSAYIGVLVESGFGIEDGLGFDGTVICETNAECSAGLVHKIEFGKGGGPVATRDSEAYEGCFREASGDSVLRRQAAAMAYLLFKDGRMLTHMGCETGHKISGCAFDMHTFEPAPNANFQYFCSELAQVYLSNPGFWCGSVIGERNAYFIRETRRCADDFEMILVCDLSGNGGDAYIYADGEWRVSLDSSMLLGCEKAIVSGKMGRAMRISLPEYGAVILERIK